jgi:hypothetical protein
MRMKGDFTRNTFNKRKHYSRVLMQQGRVQVDADWNEQIAIDAHIDRTARRDIIGHCGGPQGTAPDNTPLAGFEIVPQGTNLRITAGRYYVDGILVENETDHLFTAQPDFRSGKLPTTPGTYLIYLDVWERHLTALEDPAIREVALGGPDTATRARVMGQVKWQAIPAGGECSDFGPGWVPDGASSTGRLAARAEPDPAGSQPCIVPEAAGYRRLENQLYRVEIHTAGGLGTATFKWSRENGSIVTRWKGQDGDNLIVSSTGRDEVLGFANRQWIELIDEVREQAGTPGTLVMIDNVQGDIITIDPTTATGTTDLADFDAATARIRRWDSNGEQIVTVPADHDGWIALEEGVQIKFQAGAFRTGDYWLIPARTLTHDVEWDVQADSGPEGFQLRHGIRHHYCPLAIGPLTANGWGTLTACRRLFPPLTEIDRGASCCTVTVGDGVTSIGDFDDIQQAIDSLEGSGRICILAGVYRLRTPVKIRGMDLVITGCGRQTAIMTAGTDPAFVIRNSQVEMLALTMQASSDLGVVVADEPGMLTIRECTITNLGQPDRVHERPAPTRGEYRRPAARRFIDRSRPDRYQDAGGPAITIAEGEQITIKDNLLSGSPAIVSQARVVQIADNQIGGGGVWIADGSADVRVVSNEISRGAGPGIILGGVPQTIKLPDRDTGVETVHIVDNTIIGMQDSGITGVIDIEQDLELGELEDIHIRQNRIRHCALRGPNPLFDPIAAGGIVLRDVIGLHIDGNQITNNGDEKAPACGVFVFSCVGMQVTDNYIAENGSPAEQRQDDGPQAYQAGIAALLVIGGEVSLGEKGERLAFQSAGPAALIHDNVVVCPRGQALIVGALGPVSISGNTLTSQGLRRQPTVNSDDAFSLMAVLGQSVFVANLGRTPGLGGGATGPVGGTASPTRGARKTGHLAALRSILPDGRTLFHGNQVTLEVLDDTPHYIVSSAALLSGGDVSLQDNQLLTLIYHGQVLSSVLAMGVTVRAHSNLIHELPHQAAVSYFSAGTLMNNATGNQGTHCILVAGPLVVDRDNQEAITTYCEDWRKMAGTIVATIVRIGFGDYSVQVEDVIKG